MLVFLKRGNQCSQRKTLWARRETATNSTHVLHQARIESFHTSGRPALTPNDPCSPKVIISEKYIYIYIYSMARPFYQSGFILLRLKARGN